MNNALSLLLIFHFTFLSFSQDGTLDLSFGNNGTTIFAIADKDTRPEAFQLLNDDSMLIGIDATGGPLIYQGLYIYRVFPNGQIDSDFGQNGVIYFPYGNNGPSKIFSMALQNDGKILVKCKINDESKLLRIDQNGIFDTTFGNNGIASVTDGMEVKLQSNNKIIVGGQFWDGTNNYYNFSRYNTDGTIDLTFGDNGTVITDITSFTYDIIMDIAIQSDDKIIAVGMSYSSPVHYRPVITRFNEDGFLDNSFGDNGTIITSFGSQSILGQIYDVEIYPNDQIIVGGNLHYSGGTGGFGGSKPALIKFEIDGSYDTTFGDQGKVVFETIFNANDSLRTILLQADGKILFGGGASYPFPIMQTYFYISRLLVDGSRDESFGDDGIFLTNFNNSVTNYVHDFALQNNDYILAFGISRNPDTENINSIICRLTNEPLSVPNYTVNIPSIIYPNPTANFLTIKSDFLISQINVYNKLGQLLLSNSNKNSIDISILNKGMYFVIIKDIYGKVENNKVIKL